ncbi:MAG: non-heme iron oxygenase ferredoxin subunit [Boseongicola sp.]|nr:non-heme iron oxygenase ferredoxin subunit [Boseongicola sp.]MYH58029.1 non-heme iron oxygenase ferredoxin subunit [Boseongicola sp. SB0675_bin_26]
MTDWVDACATTDVDEEDLIAWRHGGRSYAIYRTAKGFFATDLMCTHERQSLEDGLVIDGVIECPLHGGRFDICTGKALSAPASVDLKTYPVKVEEGRVLVAAGD